MRKACLDLQVVKRWVSQLSGEALTVYHNAGRKRFARYHGSITEVYPALFTVEVSDGKVKKNLTCSYADVLCGRVILKRIKKESVMEG